MGPEAISQIYASEIISGFDLYMPQKMNVLFSRFGDQEASYFQLLRSMGFELPVMGDTYGHYEDNHKHVVFHSLGIVAQGAAGASVDITLDPVDLDANNNFYPRLWDTVLFVNEVQGSIIAIDKTTDPTAPVLTVQPSDKDDQIPALVAGQEIIIHSDAWSEGSGQPDGALSGTWEYDNDLQIIKEAIGATGTEMTNQTWVDVTSEGSPIKAYYYLGQADMDYRMALKIDGALMWGKRTTTTMLDPVTGRQIKTTEGLIPYTRRVGNEQTYVAGAFDVEEFDEMDNTLDQNFAGNHILGMLGIGLHQELENALVAYFANTNIQYARQTTNDVLFNSDESLAASVNFKYLTKSERTFLFKRMGAFNNPTLYGADGYEARTKGLLLPLNKKKDPKSNKMVDSIGTRYKALGDYSRRMEVWNIGGAGAGMKITQFDRRDWYQRANVGAHFRGGNQFVLMETA